MTTLSIITMKLLHPCHLIYLKLDWKYGGSGGGGNLFQYNRTGYNDIYQIKERRGEWGTTADHLFDEFPYGSMSFC